ncbi:MAG: BREX-2 system adenine-specific DNA-methyltransferase PglX [Gaiellaceae bacterium MAG52_C11]|nr:BREX-2 system adenine-specific DNA-methyltransferase PglX [Candidatus Gaiellasilicea maunaloa]
MPYEHQEAVDAKRTNRSREEWERERITQAAVAWVLGCVFVRFLEDNALIDPPTLSGGGPRLRRARDEEAHYFRQNPERTAREYLEDTFRRVEGLPGCGGLFDLRHNPLWQLPISGDAARELLERWRAIDPQTGALIHDFADQVWGTRFLGDLYQDLSEAARKQYALLQTPEFVEEFILGHTLEPAIDEFGLETVRLIDPACGSGHFLLGAFHRLLGHWREREPGEDGRAHVQRVLAAITGVDLNPFAAAIARFRLLIAALHACDIRALRNAPDFVLEVAVGDSLLHTPRPDRLDVGPAGIRKGLEHVYATEDAADLRRILGEQYHAVVANPPYITPKDAALRIAYRDRFASCYREYALSVPFMELLFDLAVRAAGSSKPAGFVGQITSNSFMKREFGKVVIEDCLAKLDLTMIVDTSGAYIPGHATPTVILIGRNRLPVSPTIKTVMGVRGEPAVPIDPALGVVWTSILAQVDRAGSASAYVTVGDIERARFRKHPWSLGGGGRSELRERLERRRPTLQSQGAVVGFVALTGEDDVFGVGRGAFTKTLVSGEDVRDWVLAPDSPLAFWPYNNELILLEPDELGEALQRVWPFRTNLLERRRFGIPMRELGRRWYEWRELYTDKLRTSLSIVFAEVATHNHFLLDRGGNVFKQTAPVIKLQPGSSEEEHIGLLGLMNSSVACFWLKQVCQNKGGGGVGGGIGDEAWEPRYQLNGTKVGQFPLPETRPFESARRLDELAARLAATSRGSDLVRAALVVAKRDVEETRLRMVSLQEELDWEVYRLYGLIEEALTCSNGEAPSVRPGERAFEIVLARRVAAGEEETTWFERHGSTPITHVPLHWPENYRKLVERRIGMIESDRDIGLIERSEYKRRWQWEPWEKQQERALRVWLLDRLEDERHWRQPQLTSCARLADEVRNDPEFRSVAELYAQRADVDLAKLVETLVTEDAVPYLATWCYADDGLRIRAAWEETWELQRREDAIDALGALPDDDPQRLPLEQAKARKQVDVGLIPVPPKYTSKSFRKGVYWQLRGKLDVPKERFILYPGCERAADPSPVIGWAGWNHLERSKALAHYLTRMRHDEQWGADRLTPLLAGVAELLPWVLQWHNVLDPSLGRRVGDAYSDFLLGQLAELGLTRDDLAAWRPPSPTHGRRRTTAVVTS